MDCIGFFFCSGEKIRKSVKIWRSYGYHHEFGGILFWNMVVVTQWSVDYKRLCRLVYNRDCDQWCSPKIFSGVTVRNGKPMSNVAFRFFCHKYLPFSVIYIIILYFHFAHSSTHTATFDFAETFCTSLFFEFQHLYETQWYSSWYTLLNKKTLGIQFVQWDNGKYCRRITVIASK